MTDRLLTLAIGSGRTHAEVYEYWSERASHREYDANQPRAEAEQLAIEDVEAWLREIARLRRKLDERIAAEGLRHDCNHEGATVSHCPYQAEINGDDSPCRCCDGCRHECAMDI